MTDEREQRLVSEAAELSHRLEWKAEREETSLAPDWRRIERLWEAAGRAGRRFWRRVDRGRATQKQ